MTNYTHIKGTDVKKKENKSNLLEIESNYRCYQLDIPLALQYKHNKADIQMLLHFYVFNQGLAQGNFISYELLINQMALLHYSITNSGRQHMLVCRGFKVL